ncbi:hypothetical protein CC2G_011582 [Coprinopsis cinerea AmutBmut pab1-1]|nr:hypothetical protein CC2G_011582 [Coprinopsis cinerea AmutBmut pab1-1]
MPVCSTTSELPDLSGPIPGFEERQIVRGETDNVLFARGNRTAREFILCPEFNCAVNTFKGSLLLLLTVISNVLHSFGKAR